MATNIRKPKSPVDGVAKEINAYLAENDTELKLTIDIIISYEAAKALKNDVIRAEVEKRCLASTWQKLTYINENTYRLEKLANTK